MAYPSQLDIEIANDALIRLSEAPLNSFSDNTVQARTIARLYPRVRATMFSSYDWRFATARALLVTTGVAAVAPWAYEYLLPDGVAKVRLIQATTPGVDMRPLGPREFEEGISFASDGMTLQRVIRCDVSPAILDYTCEIVDPTLWNSGFLSAFTWQLAAEIALPITGNGQMAQAISAAADRAIMAQMGPNQVQSVTRPDRGPSTTTAARGR